MHAGLKGGQSSGMIKYIIKIQEDHNKIKTRRFIKDWESGAKLEGQPTSGCGREGGEHFINPHLGNGCGGGGGIL